MMITVAEAQARSLALVAPLPPEQVALANALGRVLVDDLISRRTQPPSAVSAMDGYAVRAADVATLPAPLTVIGRVPAGAAFDGTVGPGEAVRIFTGAPVPDGADTIVIQENTEADGNTVRVVDGEAPVGRYIRPGGLDFRKGDVLIKAGHPLTARELGLAAGMNRPWLTVRRRPRVALLATGDEVVMPGEPVAAHQIVSSNGLALTGFVTAMGGEPVDLGIAPDSADALRAMAAGAHGADMLITTGGASVGDHDLVQSVLGEVGLEVDFWRIAMRPGKPLIAGRFGDTPMLGLPGNPVSAIVCAVMFLAPALKRMQGYADCSVRKLRATLAVDLGQNDEREDYLRSRLETAEDGTIRATPFDKQDSSMFATMAHADGLVVRAPHAPSAKAGDTVTVIPLGGSAVSI